MMTVIWCKYYFKQSQKVSWLQVRKYILFSKCHELEYQQKTKLNLNDNNASATTKCQDAYAGYVRVCDPSKEYPEEKSHWESP